MENDATIMSEIISEDLDDYTQIRLTVNEFRGVQYLHLRQYYMDFDEQWLPTPKGIAIPITIDNISNMFNALIRMLAKSDVLHIIVENSTDTIIDIIHEALSDKIKARSK